MRIMERDGYMQQKGTNPIYKNRNYMSRLFMERGFSMSTAAALVAPMRGKNEEEKEKMAEELIAKVLSGEIQPER